jgi:hypothetical protein
MQQVLDVVRFGILGPNAMEWIKKGLGAEESKIRVFLCEGLVWLAQDSTYIWFLCGKRLIYAR